MRVQLAELVALETLRSYPLGDTSVLVRSLRLSSRTADTFQAASTELHDYHCADTTQTLKERPLLAESKKRGVGWLRSLWALLLLLAAGIFFGFYCTVKNK